MPADIKASRYCWYMNVSDEARVVRWVWEPDSTFLSSMTHGSIHLETKSEPDDEEWEHHDAIGSCPWIVAGRMCRDQGFVVEVPEYD